MNKSVSNFGSGLQIPVCGQRITCVSGWNGPWRSTGCPRWMCLCSTASMGRSSARWPKMTSSVWPAATRPTSCCRTCTTSERVSVALVCPSVCVCVSASAAHHGALLTSDLIHSADLWPHSLRWPLTSHSHDSLTCINKSPVYLCESYQTCPGHTSPWNLKNFSNLYYHLNFYVKFWV